MAYSTLRAEIARTGLTLTQIVNDGRVGCNLGTLSNKINGRYPFTLNEAKALKQAIGSRLTLDELFEDDNTGND